MLGGWVVAAGLAAVNLAPSQGPRETELGRGIFRIHCAPCHGIHAQGGRAPDLTRGVFASGDSDDELVRTISQGVPGTEMNAFAPGIPEDDIRRMVAYIRSVNRHETGPPPGDPGRGEALFWQKGSCGSCHRVGGRGVHIAPDLTRVGRRRSLAYLREAVIAPSAAIAPGYATIQVNLPDGRTLTGIEKGLDNFTVQLMDMEGRFYSFDKSATLSVKRVPDSLMPSYAGLLSPAELTDLVAYLAGLRGEEVQP